MIYLDTAIILKTKMLRGLIEFCRDTSFAIPITYHNFNCYTNSKTFEYLQNDAQNFSRLDAHIHAAFIGITKNLLSSLVMKAWVTCALDSNCISPEGARLAPCCGCHRFDQSALQIILSHFYLIPTAHKHFPTYGIELESKIHGLVLTRPD